MIRYYKMAADQGHPAARYNLGLCYKKGKGVEKDINEAINYFLLSAEQGHVLSQAILGWCYENGEGVEINIKEAVRFYKLSLEQNHKSVVFRLQHLITQVLF